MQGKEVKELLKKERLFQWELAEALNISEFTLSRWLRGSLNKEREMLINRKVYPVVPPKTEYSLTDFGNTLAPILDAMCDWGTVYLDKLEIRLACCKSKKGKAT